MDTKSITVKYKSSVIQIATPHSTGTGFYLAAYDIIVTNEHVVRDNRSVVIDGDGIEKQLSKILYIDEKYDLAFLEAPTVHTMQSIDIRDSAGPVVEGEDVIALGHPFGMNYAVTKGIISNTLHEIEGINYFQHDAALNPGNSGGPLISRVGEVVGVNTFIIQNGNSIGFSLPYTYLVDAISEFQHGNGVQGVRCSACAHIVFEDTNRDSYCPHCGSEIEMISQIEEYEATGVSKNIENLLVDMGYDLDLSRMGPHNWSVIEGSAKINLAYHEKSGLVTGDAYLATLPSEDVMALYKYLLQENYALEGLTLSVKGKDIILSLLIFDQYMDREVTKKLFSNLIISADHYDNILVEQYGAEWISKQL